MTLLFVGLVVVYGANGREIGSYDSRPTALAARELLLRHTTSLNHVVGATPEYATRWGFILANDGNYRSVYSPVPSLATAALTWPLWRTGLIDVRAPLAPALMAKTTASVLVALAVVLSYRTARRWLPPGRALLVAVGLGLGTGFWSSASQTLWQTETAVLGLAVAIRAAVHMRESRASAAWLGIGLALAGCARPQLGPAIVMLLIGAWWYADRSQAMLAAAITGVGAAALAWTYWHWFGDPLGALPSLEGVNAQLHDTGRTFAIHAAPLLGLLVSPNRGLFVFSPIVLVAAAGLAPACRAGRDTALPWCVAALVAQVMLYGTFAVWWGGHTFGPRYLLDVLPLLVPPAALALGVHRPLLVRAAMIVALCWSVLVAGTGAFYYPHGSWNSDPMDVDLRHARLWSWSDMEIVRCWRAGPSPQNFGLFDLAAVRVVPAP